MQIPLLRYAKTRLSDKTVWVWESERNLCLNSTWMNYSNNPMKKMKTNLNPAAWRFAVSAAEYYFDFPVRYTVR
jgi:hypothetical protein